MRLAGKPSERLVGSGLFLLKELISRHSQLSFTKKQTEPCMNRREPIERIYGIVLNLTTGRDRTTIQNRIKCYDLLKFRDLKLTPFDTKPTSKKTRLILLSMIPMLMIGILYFHGQQRRTLYSLLLLRNFITGKG